MLGRYVIIRDLKFSEYMKDVKGEIKVYDTLEDAQTACWIYEFDEYMIMKIEYIGKVE